MGLPIGCLGQWPMQMTRRRTCIFAGMRSKPGPDRSQIVDRVDVGNDGVMARPCLINLKAANLTASVIGNSSCLAQIA